MAIPGLNPALTAPAAPAASTEAGAANGASQTDFLKLLVAQLEHQDPLDPQKGADFVAQLAQFSSLEQATQMNKSLDSISATQVSAQRAALAGFIGKTVSAHTDGLVLGAMGAPSLSLHLDSAASKTQLIISDANGTPVRTLDLGARAAGDSAVVWDGTGLDGQRLPQGTYSIRISATAPDGTQLTGQADVKGVVDTLEFPVDGSPRFRVGGATVAPSDIVSVNN